MNFGGGGQGAKREALAKTFERGYMRGMENAANPGQIGFMKMHGAGNDFVIIDSRGRGSVVSEALARALGDRNRGVGFDQLAEIRDAEQADFALEFWNSDGSRAGACGNASRCVSDYMMQKLGRDAVQFVTERGLLQGVRLADGRVSVNLGAPQLDWRAVPVAHDMDLMHLPLQGDPVALGMGNPHCVFFVEDAEAVDLREVGPEWEYNPLFPQRTNVEFASVIGPDRLRMRVWERGAGVTLACGSGTCATAVAAHLRGLTGRRVVVEADGGLLEVDWREDGVWLTGPVVHVFDGVVTPAFLAAL
jgi:diaminopimelate epimerase